MIETMSLAETQAYYSARASAARKQGHLLEGPGVMGPGTFHVSCQCGAKLSSGELSAVTTPCALGRD